MPRRLFGADRQRERALQEALQTRISAQFERNMRGEIQRAMSAMADAWEASGKVPDDDEHYRRVRALLLQDWQTAIETFGDRVLDVAKGAHGPRWIKTDRDDLMERLVQEFLVVRGGDQITSIVSQTTRDQVLSVIEIGRREGLGQQAIQDRVRRAVESLPRWRAGVIARTETHSAANWSQVQVAKDSDLPMRKEWISAQDERTREDHSAVDGSTAELDGAFIVGGESLAHPGDPAGSAEATINCRCATTFVVSD